MSEETEGQETGAEAVAGGVAGVTGADPAAVALALTCADRSEANAYLREQRSLAADQRGLIATQQHHLTEQFKQLAEQLKQLRLQVWEKRLGVLLRIATAFVGVVIAAGLAFMIWGASQSSGLLIEPFSVPPDLPQRGLTGQVVAGQMLDKLATLQNSTRSLRPARSYANNWGNDIKVEIPETGVSIGEVYRFLREWLGHDTHIAGEIVRTASGLNLTARAGENGAVTVTGSETDFDGLVQKSAEAIYRATQPYRYSQYLFAHGRDAEGIAILKSLATTGSGLDRLWGNASRAQRVWQIEGIDTSLHMLQKAIADEPDNVSARSFFAQYLIEKSLPEQAIRALREALSVASKNRLQMFSANEVPLVRIEIQAYIDQSTGDFRDADQQAREYLVSGSGLVPLVSARMAIIDAKMHDFVAASTSIEDVANYRVNSNFALTSLSVLEARMLMDSEARNWSGVLSQADATAPLFRRTPGIRTFSPTMTVPLTAYAEARLGKVAEAEAHISATPADCYDCLITRARMAELEGQHGRADYWFARAIDGQKSIPFAYSYWGQALMGRGDYDGAIAKFTIANQKGPKFADPLEFWGEALMTKNQSHLALAKFEEADKYAPNWGHLHLKWGEALGYAGRKDEARAQFQKASTLDLTAADKAALARVGHG